MINLLPPREKENIVAEKAKKVAIILWLLIFFFVVCLFSILFSIKVYLKSQIATTEVLLDSFESDVTIKKINNFKEKAKIANSLMADVDKFYSTKIYYSKLLESIFSILPEDSYLNDFSIQEKDEKIQIFITGFSPKRDSLIAFKNNLEKESIFKDIDFPAFNWVKAENINFSVKFIVNQ